MDILLIGGLWLDGAVWRDVAEELERLGHRPVPITLPGQGDGNAAATLEDQVATVVAAVDAAAGSGSGTGSGKCVVVGHSAASGLAWLAADARPDQVARTVMIGGFPSGDGQAYADIFEVRDGAMAFPGWGPFEGPDSDDLDEPTRARIAAGAIPVPEGVAKGVVRLTDERRYDVPAVVICPEFTPDQAREWMEQGQIPELSKVKHLDLVDLDTGHWPMVSAPQKLARMLAEIAGRSPARTRQRGMRSTRNEESEGVRKPMEYTVSPLNAETWDRFAELVERNNGVFGGCWCIGFHPECGQRGVSHRELKEERVRGDRAHAALVLDEAGKAQGWCQYGSPDELSDIKHRRVYDKDAPPLPDWRITCFYVDTKHRGQGIARAALEGAIGQIAQAGGGLAEAIPEVTLGREAQGRFLFSATVELFEDYGFERVRQVGKHAWIVSRVIDPA